MIECDPCSLNLQDTVSMSIVFSPVIKNPNNTWTEYANRDTEVVIWKFRLSHVSPSPHFSDLPFVLGNVFESSRSVVESSSDSLHFNSSIITGSSISKRLFVLHMYNMLEFKNETVCYDLTRVGYNRLSIMTRDDKLTTMLLEDFAADRWNMGLDMKVYLRSRLLQHGRFSLAVLKSCLMKMVESGRLHPDHVKLVSSISTAQNLAAFENEIDKLGPLFEESDYFRLIRIATATELSNIITCLRLDPKGKHPHIMIRDDGSLSFVLSVAPSLLFNNVLMLIQTKKFIKSNIQIYLSLREPLITDSRSKLSLEMGTCIGNRIKEIETNKSLQMNFGFEPEASDFFTSKKHQKEVEYFTNLMSLLTEDSNSNDFFSVGWAIPALMIADRSQTNETRNLNTTLSFYFNLLLSRASLLHLAELSVHYKTHRMIIDNFLNDLSYEFESRKLVKMEPLSSQSKTRTQVFTQSYIKGAASLFSSTLVSTSNLALLALFHEHITPPRRTGLIEDLPTAISNSILFRNLNYAQDLISAVSLNSHKYLKDHPKRNMMSLADLSELSINYAYQKNIKHMSIYIFHYLSPSVWPSYSSYLFRSDPPVYFIDGLAQAVSQAPNTNQAIKEFYKCATSLYTLPKDQDYSNMDPDRENGPWNYLAGDVCIKVENRKYYQVQGEEVFLFIYHSLKLINEEVLARMASMVCEQKKMDLDIQKLFYHSLISYNSIHTRKTSKYPLCRPPGKGNKSLYAYLSTSVPFKILPKITPDLALDSEYPLFRDEILKLTQYKSNGNIDRIKEMALSIYNGDFQRKDFEHVI